MKAKILLLFSSLVVMGCAHGELSARNVASHEFEVMYKDSGGLEWSQQLGDNFANETDRDIRKGDGWLVGPDAATQKACASIGGSLPTADEYRVLMKDLGVTDARLLKELIMDQKGQKNFRRKFKDWDIDGDGKAEWYWTATVSKLSKYYALFFSDTPEGDFSGSRNHAQAVRCVR